MKHFRAGWQVYTGLLGSLSINTLHRSQTVLQQGTFPLLPDKVWDEDPDGAVVGSYEVAIFNGRVHLFALV